MKYFELKKMAVTHLYFSDGVLHAMFSVHCAANIAQELAQFTLLQRIEHFSNPFLLKPILILFQFLFTFFFAIFD